MTQPGVVPELPSMADVRAAAARIRGRVHRTPVFSSTSLQNLLGAPVNLKAELLQRSGSFKVRGAFNRIEAMPREAREAGVVTVSSGNHAQAVALASAEIGVDALVLMPRNASTAKVEATRAYGATVDLSAADAAEALAHLDGVSRATGRVIVHPFDDPLVIAGQGTVALEAAEQAPDADIFVVAVGGGGLISGVAIAMKTLRPAARVIAVQPERAATLGPALSAGKPVEVPWQDTIADALTAPAVGQLCLRACSTLVDDVVTVSEDEIREGLRFVYQRAKLACEPAAATPVAALLAGKIETAGSHGVVAVVSGGNIGLGQLAQLLAEEPGDSSPH